MEKKSNVCRASRGPGFVVYADYFESGNRYEISRCETLELAHTITQRAETTLTESERKAYGYTIRRELK